MASVAEIFKSMDYGPAPEGAAPAQAWLDGHHRAFGHFIGGAFTEAGRETFETANPATGESLAQISQGTDADIDAAVKAARDAQPEWEAIGGHARARFSRSPTPTRSPPSTSARSKEVKQAAEGRL